MTNCKAETHYFLIDPVLREKGYDDYQRLKLETPSLIELTSVKGRRCINGGYHQPPLNQEDQARQLGISYDTVTRWENGQAKPSKLARALLDAFCERMQAAEMLDLSEAGRG